LKLVLASRSPRRAELLTAAGIEFTVRSADIDETPRAGEDPMDYVLRLAEEKAWAVPCHAGETVLAADTTVVLGREILGKPVDRPDAARMLGALSGRGHEVITGVCLRSHRRTVREASVTAVWFAAMTAAEIEDYVASAEPMDKAGAYGIQGIASRYIERIEGAYTNVVGLPVAMVYRLLQQFSSVHTE
jgi:septum formation protein